MEEIHMYYFDGMINQEGYVVNRMLFFEFGPLSNSVSVERRIGTGIFKWRTGKDAYNGKDGKPATCDKGLERYASIKEWLYDCSDDTAGGTAKFYDIKSIFEYMYNEKSKWFWKAMPQSRRDAYHGFFRENHDAGRDTLMFKTFQSEWNRVAVNFDFLKDLKGQEKRAIVKVIEDCQQFKKNHFYVCVQANELSAMLLCDDGTRAWISRSKILNGYAINFR